MEEDKMKYVDKYEISGGIELSTILEIRDMQDWKIDATGESVVLLDDNSKIIITDDESGENSLVYVYTEKYSIKSFIKHLIDRELEVKLVEYKIG